MKVDWQRLSPSCRGTISGFLTYKKRANKKIWVMTRFDREAGRLKGAPVYKQLRTTLDRPTLHRLWVRRVDLLGRAAHTSENIGRRGTVMSFEGCTQSATSSVCYEQAVLLASLLTLTFTLNDKLQAHIAFLQILRRKRLRYGAPVAIVLVLFVETTASSSISWTFKVTCTVRSNGSKAAGAGADNATTIAEHERGLLHWLRGSLHSTRTTLCLRGRIHDVQKRLRKRMRRRHDKLMNEKPCAMSVMPTRRLQSRD